MHPTQQPIHPIQNGEGGAPGILQLLRDSFIGTDTPYRLADGSLRERIYLDSAATCLPSNMTADALRRFAAHYANTHSKTHFSARISSATFRWAHRQVLDFLRADQSAYDVVFCGSGATAAFNRVAHLLSTQRAARDTVLVSIMEHHSNDLPHRRRHRRTMHIPTEGEGGGRVCLRSLEQTLREEGGRVNYLALTAASNVTGVCNQIRQVTELAHRFGVLVVLDASQAIAHRGFDLRAGFGRDVDVLVFSGHKIYAPGSPGVLVCKKSLLGSGDPYELGGGIVEHVYLEGYDLAADPVEREEAGTPNILGAIGLGFMLGWLGQIGMDVIEELEHGLLARLSAGLASIAEVTVYGVAGVALSERTATLAIAVAGLDHGLLAAVLNDYFAIETRNQCFCAHPYVRELIKRDLWELDESVAADPLALAAKLGLVRVSLGIYNTEDDVDALIAALREIAARRGFYLAQYQLLADGEYQHRQFRADAHDLFDPDAVSRGVVADAARQGGRP